MVENIIKKDQVMISLLGRIAFPEDKVKEIIIRKKRTPEAYIRGYNACDGKSTVTEIAKVIGVNQSTLTPILQDWESKGIIYEIDSNKGKTYMKLYPLPNPKEKSAQNQEEPLQQTPIESTEKTIPTGEELNG